MAGSIETERLRLEPLAPPHLAGYTALIAQQDVYRHLSRAADIAADPAGQAARIVAMSAEQWSKRGYGPFAIFERTGTSLIGRGGLFWVESLQDVEINYMFDPSMWSRGYATEAAKAFSPSASVITICGGWWPPSAPTMQRRCAYCERSAWNWWDQRILAAAGSSICMRFPGKSGK